MKNSKINMVNDELGTRGGMSLIVILGLSLLMSMRVSISLLQKSPKFCKEIVFLNQIPLVFGLISWAIIYMGSPYAPLDLISTSYKLLSVVVFAIYMFKEICSDSPYTYGKLQHQLIQIKKTRIFAVLFDLDSCKKVNFYMKLQLTLIMFYVLVMIGKVGIGINNFMIGEDYGTWKIDLWGAFRGLDIAIGFLIFLNLWGLKAGGKVLGLDLDRKYYLVAFVVCMHSLHPLIGYLISLSISANSNEVIVYISNLFVVVEMITLSFYQTSLYSY